MKAFIINPIDFHEVCPQFQRRGMLESLGFSFYRPGGFEWLHIHVRCDCGRELYIDYDIIDQGHCGCRTRIARKSAFADHPKFVRLNAIYNGMVTRCENEYSQSYKYYGARGIKVCDEWYFDRDKFFEWALANGYEDNLTIDRIDNYRLGYCPENCRWVTKSENVKNSRRAQDKREGR